MIHLTNFFEEALTNYYGAEILQRLRGVKVGICGAGGLGSNCAVHLVRSGITRLRIIDFDRVEYSNLNRQFFFLDQLGCPKVESLRENLLRINPGAEIEVVAERLTSDNALMLLEGCDIIVEAFDLAERKAELVSAVFSDGRPLVACSGIAGYGSSDRIKVRKVCPNFLLVGDMESDTADAPPYSAIVGIAAAKEADAVIEYILNGGWK